MILATSMFSRLQDQYQRVVAQVARLDKGMLLHYGERYSALKSKLISSKEWYEREKAAAISSGITPLEKSSQSAHNQVAQIGLAAANKEEELKKKIREAGHSIGKS